MKQTLIFLALGFIVLHSCKQEKPKSPPQEIIKGSENDVNSGKEYTSAYICPMHCKGSGSAKPGQCPVCEMDYVANKDFKAEEKLPEEASEEDDHN